MTITRTKISWPGAAISLATLPAWLPIGVVALIYLLPGSIGHEPWKPDEAYVFGGVFHILQTGDWVVPHVGGEPFLEKPPLYHLVAASMAYVFSPVLPMHDAARLASVLFVGVALCCVGYAARLTWGDGHGRCAVLLALASLGLVVHAHMMLPDLPLMAGVAMSLAGYSAWFCHRPNAAMLLGSGVGIAFLAKGLIGPGIVAPVAVLLPLLFPEWRQRSYAILLFQSGLWALPWLTIWPVALYLRSPDLFYVWFFDNNVGRFLGYSVSRLGAEKDPGFLLHNLPWFIFPAWLFAGAALWRYRLAGLRHPAIQIGGTFFITIFILFGISASARVVYLLPTVAGIALLGAGGVGNASARLDRLVGSAGLLLAAIASMVAWTVWTHMIFDGQPPAWPWLLRWLPADFVMPISGWKIAGAVLITASVAIATVVAIRRRSSGLWVWVGSITVVWGLLATLWLPWIDAARGYGRVFRELPQHLTPGQCVASRGLGEGERALLEYFAGLRTERIEVRRGADCTQLLVQDKCGKTWQPGESWLLVWQGGRRGDEREVFRLYRRLGEPVPST